MWPVTSEHGGKADRGPLSESMYTACSTQLTTGLACTLSLTREYMENGGRLLANCALTVYYLPVYPPYSDSNYRLWGLQRESLAWQGSQTAAHTQHRGELFWSSFSSF